MDEPDTYTAFRGHHRVLAGSLPDLASGLRELPGDDPTLVLVFADETGQQVDLDLSGSPAEVAARYGRASMDGTVAAEAARRRGRPRLGVVGREVTLLPRHWEWLQAQRGSPSATLRRLIDEARAAGAGRDRVRRAQDAINRFVSAVAGDLPGFEEATRALYRGDRHRFETEIAGWPADLRAYLEHWSAVAFSVPEEPARTG